jgi:hypothetical protein
METGWSPAVETQEKKMGAREATVREMLKPLNGLFLVSSGASCFVGGLKAAVREEAPRRRRRSRCRLALLSQASLETRGPALPSIPLLLHPGLEGSDPHA